MRPRIELVTPHALVRADKQIDALAARAWLEQLVPAVRAELVGTATRPLELWYVRTLRRSPRELSPAHVAGFTRFVEDGSIQIHLRVDEDPRWALAHELVHAQTGPSWDPLPGVVNEGLADVVAERVCPDLSPLARATRVLNASRYFGGLHLTVRYQLPESGETQQGRVHLRTSPEGEVPDPALPFELDRWELNRELAYLPETYYGLGYLAAMRVVERGGIAGLHALCAHAQSRGEPVVPAARLFDLGELNSIDDWERGLESLLGAAELRVLHTLDPELLPSVMALSLRDAYGELPASEFLERARPRVVGVHGEELSLAELPQGVERFERAWSK